MRGGLGGVVPPEKLAEGCHQPDDLLLADLHAPAEAVVRRLGALARDPVLDVDVHVERLESDGLDQLTATGEDARALRTTDGLPAAERDERGALLDEPA